MLNKKIFTPGPTQVPQTVLNAVTSHITYHRSKEFKDFHLRLISKLKNIFFTNGYLNVLTVSGTGSMDTAVVNFCSPGDKIIYINQGRFGMRWGSICKNYGLESVEIVIETGKSLTPDDLKKIDFNGVSAIFFTHVETSTATITDLKEICSYIKNKSDALIISDSVTSVGAVEFKMDEWGVDVAVSASQKGLMTPPGLAMIAYSERAKDKMLKGGMARYYMDLRKEYKEQHDGLTAWTPAVGLMYGLDEACNIVQNYGLEKWWDKVHECAEYTRKAGEKIGLRLLSSFPSDSLTAFLMPDEIPSGKLLAAMKSKYGVQMANGQAELNNRIFRISHMGDLYLEDFKQLMELIETEYNLLLNSK